MRLKIIGENNCARATRHLLRLAGFAVTDFLPADAVIQGPAAGYAITIDLASGLASDLSPASISPNAHLGPESAPQQKKSSMSESAFAENLAMADLPSSAKDMATAGRPSFLPQMATARMSPFLVKADSAVSLSGKPFLVDGSRDETSNLPENISGAEESTEESASSGAKADTSAVAGFSAKAESGPLASYIHFDSVDSALETAVLRHVSQLAGGPVIVDRPGGVVRSERELRIVAPCSGDARADEAAAVAIEFGILRGLLDLVSPGARGEMRWSGAGRKLLSGGAVLPEENVRAGSRRKKLWWPFAVVFFCVALGAWNGARGNVMASGDEFGRTGFSLSGVELLPLLRSSKADRLKPVLLEAQGQFATGANSFVVDPCQGQTKLYASINQTGNTQLVAGTAARKIYVCSIHVVAAAATDVAVVEGTGSVCATGTAGVSGFGGATATTGWNFAGNGGIALGSGESSLGAEGTSGDNLCVFNSGSGQVSGGISYVVE